MNILNSGINLFEEFDKISHKLRSSEYYPTDLLPSLLIMWHWGEDVRVINNSGYDIFMLKHEFSNKNCLTLAGKISDTASLIDAIKGLSSSKLDIRYLPLTDEQKETLFENNFNIIRDADMDDYIYSTFDLSNFDGSQYKTKRQYLKKFNTLYGDHLELEVRPEASTDIIPEVMKLHEMWEAFGTDGSSMAEEEKLAIQNVQHFKQFSPRCFGSMHTLLVKVKGHLAAYILLEIENNIAYCLFQKTNLNLTGITEFVYNLVGRFLVEKGVSKVNYFNDMGIPGLRQSKLSYRPSEIDRKYIIRF